MLNPTRLYASKGPKHPQYACLSAMPEDENIPAIYTVALCCMQHWLAMHIQEIKAKLPDSAVKPMRAVHVLGYCLQLSVMLFLCTCSCFPIRKLWLARVTGSHHLGNPLDQRQAQSYALAQEAGGKDGGGEL